MSYHPGGGGTATVSGISDVPGLESELTNKAPAAHNHDLLYAGVLHAHAGYAPSSHSHPISDTTGLQAALDGKQIAGSYATSTHDHDGVYSPIGHTHPGSTVVGYTINGYAANAATTTDGQTIYFGGTPAVAPSTTGGNHRLYIPKAGAIKAAYVYANAATAGTNEAWVANIRLNNTTDTQIQSLSLSNVNRLWSNAALNISVAAGDYVEIKMVNPTWATNPANVRFAVTIYIE